MTSNKYSQYHFFERKEFSPRYGDEIFSVSFDSEPLTEKSLEPSSSLLDVLAGALGVTVSGCCVPKNIVYYNITVYQGKFQWTVKRRFSDFKALYHKLTHGTHGGGALHEIVSKIELPPTTMLDVSNDLNYCKDRQEDLAYFLITTLHEISSKHLVTEDILTFLGMDEEQKNNRSNK